MPTKKQRGDAGQATQLSEDEPEWRGKVWLRALKSEIEAWDQAAKAAGMKTGPWARSVLNKAARRA